MMPCIVKEPGCSNRVPLLLSNPYSEQLGMRMSAVGTDQRSAPPRQPGQVSKGKLTARAAPGTWRRQLNLTRSSHWPDRNLALRRAPDL